MRIKANCSDLIILCNDQYVIYSRKTSDPVLDHINFCRRDQDNYLSGKSLIMLVLGTSLLTFTTTPNELTDGLDKSLGFLNKVGVPVHEIAMMMSIALRFIPILTERIRKDHESPDSQRNRTLNPEVS